MVQQMKKDTVTIKVNVPTDIRLDEDQVLKCLEQLLNVKGYTIEDSVVYQYDRVSYDDYDYVRVDSPSPELIRRLQLFKDLTDVLSKKYQ